MLDNLQRRAAARAEARRQAQIRRIVALAPKGVTATPAPQGVLLTGRGLKRRFIYDPWLRSFWR
jgi:hypothetical protein